MTTASLFCDTKPLLNIAEYSLPLTDVRTVGIVCKLVWAFFALPVLGCKNVWFFFCLPQHFACMLYKFGCQWFLKMFLEMGTAFSEHGTLMSLNFLCAVFKAHWLSCDLFQQPCWSFSWTKLNVYEILLGEQINYWGKCALCDMWAASLFACLFFFP